MKPGSQAMALADALTELGYTAVVVSRTHRGQRYPCIRLSSGPDRHVSLPELVYATPDANDCWWFFRAASQEPIMPIAHVEAAAELIDAALTKPTGTPAKEAK